MSTASDSTESMETSDTDSNASEIGETAVISVGDHNITSERLNQFIVTSAIESFVKERDQGFDVSTPTCSKNLMPIEENVENKEVVDDICDKSKENFDVKKNKKQVNIEIPKPGTLVSTKIVKRAGPYLLGPIMGSSPVKSIVQCLARRKETNKFYTMKILTLKDSIDLETQDDRQGKMLLHSEYSLLSLLQNQDGVVHHHGFFKVKFKNLISH